MTHSHGGCAKGKRLQKISLHGHRKTTALLAVLSSNGIVPTFILEAPINGGGLQAYVL